MAINKIAIGDTPRIPYTGTPAYKSGDLIQQGEFVGVVTHVDTEHSFYVVHLTGVYAVANAAGGVVPAFDQGAAVYVTSAGALTATVGTNKLVGWAWKASVTTDTVVQVRLKL